MLMKISSLITPEVFETIYMMGHMDELVIVDANYSGSELPDKVLFLPVRNNHILLNEILRYFPLDEDEADPVHVFLPDHVDRESPTVWKNYQGIVDECSENKIVLSGLKRQEFYLRVKAAYAIIRTLDQRLYANIIIRKGVVLEEWDGEAS